MGHARVARFFPGSTKQLPSQSSLRRFVVKGVVVVHNFYTNIIGCNQIKTMFDLEYKCYVSLEGYDQISQYYLRPDDFELGVDEDDNDIKIK